MTDARQIEASPVIPLRLGRHVWQCYCVHDHSTSEGHTSAEHLVLVHSPRVSLQRWSHAVFNHTDTVPVRIHSECLFGDVFGTDRCDCGYQLHDAVETITESGAGVVVYLRQEGRGVGLFDKIRSLTVDDPDSFVRNEALGLPADGRRYSLAASVLFALGIRSARLITGNPVKVAALRDAGIAAMMTSSTRAIRVSTEALMDVVAKVRRGYSYDLPDASGSEG